jgi:hypothetical protein
MRKILFVFLDDLKTFFPDVVQLHISSLILMKNNFWIMQIFIADISIRDNSSYIMFLSSLEDI